MKKRKKAVKTIEHHLREYKSYKVGIINARRKLNDIVPGGLTAAYNYKPGTLGVFTFKSHTEELVLDRIESREVLELNETIWLYTLIVESIDKALSELEEDERQFVRLRYFENKTIEDIALELRISRRTVSRLRYNVMKHLLISLSSIKNLYV